MRRPDGTSFEFCDCVFEEWTQLENRYCRDWSNGVSISFIQARGPPIMFGLNPSFISPEGCIAPAHIVGDRCVGARQHECLPGYCDPHKMRNSSIPRFHHDMLDRKAIGAIVDLFGGNNSVHTIVLNSGAWGCLDGNSPNPNLDANSYVCVGWAYSNATALAMARGVQRLVWRGTTATIHGLGPKGHVCHNESRVLFPILRTAGWRTLDLLNPTASIPVHDRSYPAPFWDNSHYTQPYHRGTTELVLRDLLDDCL